MDKMEQQEEIYEQAEPEQKKISLRLIGCLGLIAVISFLVIITAVVWPLPMPGNDTSATDNITASDNTTGTK